MKKPEKIMERWRDYFYDLLNPINENNEIVTAETNGNMEQGANMRTSIRIAEITMEELGRAIKSLKTANSLGHDEITPEMIKCLGGKEHH